MARDVSTLEFHNRIITLQFLLDALVAFLGLTCGYFLRFYTPLKYIGNVGVEPPGFTSYAPLIGFGTLLLLATYGYLGLYSWKNLLRPRRVMPIILKGTFFWFIVFLAISLTLKFEPSVSRFFAGCAFLSVTLIMLLWHFLFFRILTAVEWSSRLSQRVAILGWNEDAAKLADLIHQDDSHPYDVAGVVMTGEEPENLRCIYPILGGISDMEEILLNSEIDILVNADLDLPRKELIDVVHLCERFYVDVKLNPSMFQIFVSNLRLETISGLPVLGLEPPAINKPWFQAIKRTIDVFGGLVGLIGAFPIMLALALIIKKQDPGPVLYKQTRIGKNGRPFTILKLRSMKVNAEAETGAVWAVENDPRRLPIGAFMREWNLDELPQFWCVLTGDMSLVGPRPERPELIRNFEKEIDHYNPRHTAKPGITGWA
ncbi:MAG: sugar transferase, partial [Verrucomicrobiota bacterium]